MYQFDQIFQPKNIAIIGGGEWNEHVVNQCRKLNFSGELWSVHPKKSEFAGLTPYKTIADLPSAPDVSFIGVNRNATITALRELNAIGAKGAVCFASGFAETSDGQEINGELLEAAGDMTILGPNCYGYLNMLDGVALWPDEHGLKRAETGVAILGQSSNLLINLGMQKRGLPISHMIACGNQIKSGFADIGIHLLEDDRVTALGIHIEGFGDIHNFQKLAQRAYMLGKPVVVLKVGVSDAAQNATMSHTASLAGSDAGADALLKRCGVARADGLTEFLSLLTIGHLFGCKNFKSITSSSCSGGEAVLISDVVDKYNIELSSLTEGQKSNLSNYLSDLVTIENPLDYHTQIWRDVKAMSSVFEEMANGDADLNCLILDFPRSDRCEPTGHNLAFDALLQASQTSPSKFALIATMPENLPEFMAETAIINGIIPFFSVDDAMSALAKTQQWRAPDSVPVLLGEAPSDIKTISEYEAKSEIERVGISVPRSIHVSSMDDITTGLDQLQFPLVLKGEGKAHKTEAGLVALNLQSKEDVLNAANDMPASSFIVEEMIGGDVVELLIGIVLDEAHGYVLTIGAGGMLTELLSDQVSLLVPADRNEILRALSMTKIHKLLTGYRVKSEKNIDELLSVIDKLQSYIIENANLIKELEINPLMVSKKSAIAVDALIVRSK
ncbi:MAG: acetate--CoA ligase family protein [Lentilitoribacter sp.]